MGVSTNLTWWKESSEIVCVRKCSVRKQRSDSRTEIFKLSLQPWLKIKNSLGPELQSVLKFKEEIS